MRFSSTLFILVIRGLLIYKQFNYHLFAWTRKEVQSRAHTYVYIRGIREESREMGDGRICDCICEMPDAIWPLTNIDIHVTFTRRVRTALYLECVIGWIESRNLVRESFRAWSLKTRVPRNSANCYVNDVHARRSLRPAPSRLKSADSMEPLIEKKGST